ncbi:MAG: hypothetical protein R2715_05510 [Ilumatobacteraceae bacterium]
MASENAYWPSDEVSSTTPAVENATITGCLSRHDSRRPATPGPNETVKTHESASRSDSPAARAASRTSSIGPL